MAPRGGKVKKPYRLPPVWVTKLSKVTGRTLSRVYPQETNSEMYKGFFKKYEVRKRAKPFVYNVPVKVNHGLVTGTQPWNYAFVTLHFPEGTGTVTICEVVGL